LKFKSIVGLEKDHDRSSFSCGVQSLDNFLLHNALRQNKSGHTRTFVAIADDNKTVLGYYCLAAGAVESALFPKPMDHPYNEVPIVLVGRLAIRKDFQHQGLGTTLLIDALLRALNVADSDIGCHAVEVDALDPTVVDWYKRFGFESLEDGERHLYLPIAQIRKLSEKW
jgi:GNAT superfamily N-acetyltransferase